MSRPKVPWLERQSTNRDALILAAVAFVLPLVLGGLNDAGVLETLPLVAWLAIGVGVFLLLLTFWAGRRMAPTRVPWDVERYSEHTADALDTLQKAIHGTIPAISLGDFVQEGIFEPAHNILTRGKRGDVRLSLLAPTDDGDEFEMLHALGHDMGSRRQLRLKIVGSFAGLALTHGGVYYSNDTDEDDRFAPHPLARSGREYRSIVAVACHEGNENEAVLVVVATEPNAFSAADRAYIQNLAGIIDVASAAAPEPSNGPESEG
jgi:hypothetical protein